MQRTAFGGKASGQNFGVSLDRSGRFDITRLGPMLDDLHGRPEFIVCDNGTEFTSLVMFDWAQRSGVGLQFIQPGKPICESFNGRVRDECLNEILFSNLREAQGIIAKWRTAYNCERPHSALNWATPNEFAKSCSGLTQNKMDKVA